MIDCVQFLKNLVKTFFKVFVSLTAYNFCIGLSSTLTLSCIGKIRFNDIQHKSKMNLSLFDTNLCGDAADRHGSNRANLWQWVTKGNFQACDENLEVRQKIIGVGDELNNASNYLARSCF
jgi:hypothetical protein